VQNKSQSFPLLRPPRNSKLRSNGETARWWVFRSIDADERMLHG
jgi:hypothetical protein